MNQQNQLIQADSEQTLVPYDESLLDRARTQWQFGDWNSLAQLDLDTLEHHPDRANLALLAAAGRLQAGKNTEARHFIHLAQDWGISTKLINQILISGVHNSLGRAAVIAGLDQRALPHFERALSVVNPGIAIPVVTRARASSQYEQLQAKRFLPENDGNFLSLIESSEKFLTDHEYEGTLALFLSNLKGAKTALLAKREMYQSFSQEKEKCRGYKKWPLVSIIIASFRPKNIERIIGNIKNQNYPNKELIIVTQDYTQSEISKLRKCLSDSAMLLVSFKIIELNESFSLGARQNIAIENSNGEYWAKMDDDDWYFPNYLKDMIITLRLGDYDLVGKNSAFVYFDGANQTAIRNPGMMSVDDNNLRGATLVSKNKFSEHLTFGDLKTGEDSELLKKAKTHGLKIYASDPFNFMIYRSASTDQHTWKMEQKGLMATSLLLGSGQLFDICEF